MALEHLLLSFLVARIEVFTDVAEHLDDGRALHPLEVLHGQVPEHPVPVGLADRLLAQMLGTTHLGRVFDLLLDILGFRHGYSSLSETGAAVLLYCI